jgi:catechol 2,3-dioxygenase-like lactoylglutathione lyase family enzyme
MVRTGGSCVARHGLAGQGPLDVALGNLALTCPNSAGVCLMMPQPIATDPASGEPSVPSHAGVAARRGRTLGNMAIQRMDNVAIVVDDLDAAVAFFTELGMELEGKAQVEGLWADRTVGLDGVRSDIVMMRTPDGHSKLELTKYHTPAAAGAEPENPPPNTLGLHRVMFAVDDINDTVARLRGHGAELLGEVAQYESIFLLCYLRGPAGIIVALAEQIG